LATFLPHTAQSDW